jgi:hypothetical protein
MKKTFAIISHDRHRDDYVYIIKCEEFEIENYVKKIWEQDNPNWEAPNKNKYMYFDDSGSHYVEVVDLKTLDN